MRINRAARSGACALAVVWVVTVTACGGGGEDSSLAQEKDGKLTIGVRFDQPGLGLRKADGTYSGFDVDVAYYVADRLGVKPENVTIKEALPAHRESLIENGQVDLVVATYSITDKRKEKVDFADPTTSSARAYWCGPPTPTSTTPARRGPSNW
nr:transporter substrate-binding domain-containing protein [Nocardia salmonicida]